MKFKLFSMMIFTFLLLSCENSNEVQINNKLKNLAAQLGFIDSPELILYTVSQKPNQAYLSGLDSNYVEAFAYITDGFDFVEPTEVRANSELLFIFGEGQYSNKIYPFPTNKIVNWDILGWSGIDYHGTQEISNPLDFIVPQYLDTVSASNGFYINYSGAADSGTISVCITPTAPENYALLGMISYPSIANISFEAPDNGTIFVPAALLSSIPKNMFYSIEINNYKLSQEEYSGRLIIKKSLFSTYTSIFMNN